MNDDSVTVQSDASTRSRVDAPTSALKVGQSGLIEHVPLTEFADTVCGPQELRNPLARQIASALLADSVSGVTLLECRRSPAEVMVVDVQAEIVQRPVHDIRDVERLALVFSPSGEDGSIPDVLALREDFPVGIPHQNLRFWERPVSLCVLDEPFQQARLQWTPVRFFALIRQWLELTARGALHGDDQPLEPLLADGEGWIILPSALAVVPHDSAASGGGVRLEFDRCTEAHGKPVLVARETKEGAKGSAEWVGARFVAQPRTHGPIRKAPRTLQELHALLAGAETDLLGWLRRELKSWALDPSTLKAKFLLIVHVPKRRSESTEIESTETWVFITNLTVAQVGIEAGAWELTGGVPGGLVVAPEGKDGRDVKIGLGYSFFTPTRTELARFSGDGASDERELVAVGAGALGGQVIMNSARAGFGRWIIVDDDVTLPHNIARHVLPREAVGYPKATAVATLTNGLVDTPSVHRSIRADVLDPKTQAAALADVYSRAGAIVDMSASVPVARMLALDVDGATRRVSLFLSPSGDDLVLLAEDVSRGIRLDALEMQFYRSVAFDERLQGLYTDESVRVRFGRTCRDVSAQLQSATVASLGAIAARALQQVLDTDGARIAIWRSSRENFAVAYVEVPPAGVQEVTVNGWQVVTDDSLLSKLRDARAAKLPDETGGVLIGHFDLLRRRVYVVDSIPSPSDSREARTSYIRGVYGLLEAARDVEKNSAGQLHYIGEWHSHPAGFGCNPSGADRELFRWIGEVMRAEGLPPVMLITGEHGEVAAFVDAMPVSGDTLSSFVQAAR